MLASGLFLSLAYHRGMEVYGFPLLGVVRATMRYEGPELVGPRYPEPLTEKGVVTQGLLRGAQGEHPGLDIAVQTDSYIRAAGGGRVVEVGTDEVYGLFVVLDHGEGYTTVYAHTSAQMVEQGQQVREREVIALSGSSGQSTAPHLHFEILLDGSAIDPLTMVEQPN